MNKHQFFQFLFLVIAALACHSGETFQRTHSGIEQEQVENNIQKIRDQPASDDAKQEADGDDIAANEPIAIGGAFLSCQYQSNQEQDTLNFLMSCQLENLENIVAEELEANFYKVDMNGDRYKLEILNQDIASFSWILIESPNTIYFPNLEAHIAINGSEPFTFKASPSKSSLSIRPSTRYWLAGEPSNINPADDAMENCAEFRNLAARNVHVEVVGTDNGPLARLNDIPCNLNRSFLCLNPLGSEQDKWLISEFSGPFNSYSQACPKPYYFGAPLSDKDYQEVIALVDLEAAYNSIWVALHNQNNPLEFEFILPQP